MSRDCPGHTGPSGELELFKKGTDMQNKATTAWRVAAISGLLAGLAGCGGAAAEPSVPAPNADPPAAPGGQSKHACGGAPGEKHACGGDHGHEAAPPAPEPPKP